MTVQDIIALFGSPKEFGEAIGKSHIRALEIRRRGSIAVRHWPRLIDEAQKRGHPEITYEALVQAHAKEAA